MRCLLRRWSRMNVHSFPWWSAWCALRGSAWYSTGKATIFHLFTEGSLAHTGVVKGYGDRLGHIAGLNLADASLFSEAFLDLASASSDIEPLHRERDDFHRCYLLRGAFPTRADVFLAGGHMLSAFLPMPGAIHLHNPTHTQGVWVSYFYYTSPVKSEPLHQQHHSLAPDRCAKGQRTELCFCNRKVTVSYAL